MNYNLYKNLFTTIVLTTISAEFFTFALCQAYVSCTLGYYILVMLFTAATVTLLLSISQYIKTLRILIPKRPHPLPIPRTLAYQISSIFFEKDSERVWVVTFTNSIRRIIHKDEFYLFLLKVAEIQRTEPQKSPISQRSHSELPRLRWQAYRRLLIDAKALVEISKNRVILKEQYVVDPWSLIEEMEKSLPMEEL